MNTTRKVLIPVPTTVVNMVPATQTVISIDIFEMIGNVASAVIDTEDPQVIKPTMLMIGDAVRNLQLENYRDLAKFVDGITAPMFLGEEDMEILENGVENGDLGLTVLEITYKGEVILSIPASELDW